MGSFFLYQAYQSEKPYQAAEKTYESIRREAAEPIAEDDTQQTERAIDFTLLKEKNEDIVGWLTVPGTQIDYPICHGADDDFYLNHNAEKEKNILGALFLPTENNPDMLDIHIIIYGHNMRQGQMFGELSNYEEEAYHRENPYVYLYLPSGEKRTYQVYSVYRCEPSSETYTLGLLPQTQAYRLWLQESVRKELFATGIEDQIAEDKQVLTLSTCADGNRKERLAVNCVMCDK